MGAWGTGLYSNDSAADARDEFNDVFSVKSVQDGVELLKNEYLKEIHEDDWDELANFWYALGDFMWNKGILTEEVKKICLDLLEQNAGMELWIEEGNKSDIKKRKEILENFKIKLKMQMPPKKKIKSSAMRSRWKVGDIIAFKPNENWIFTDSIRWNLNLLNDNEILDLQNQGYKKVGYYLEKDYSLWEDEGIKKEILHCLNLANVCNAIFDNTYKTLINKDMYMFALCVNKEKYNYSKFVKEVYNENARFVVYDYYGKVDKNVNFKNMNAMKMLKDSSRGFVENQMDNNFYKNAYNLGEFKLIKNDKSEAERLQYFGNSKGEKYIDRCEDYVYKCFIYYEIQHNSKIHVKTK